MKIIFYKTEIKNWHTFCTWKLRYYSPLNEWQLNWICEQQDNNQNILIMAKTSERGRSAIDGRFVSKDYAASHTDTTVVEKIKVGPTKHRN